MNLPPNIRLRKDLRRPLPPYAVPDGIRIVQFNPSGAERLYRRLGMEAAFPSRI